MFEIAFVGFGGYMSTMDDTVDDRLFASRSEVQHSKIECKNVNNSFPLLVFQLFHLHHFIIALSSLLTGHLWAYFYWPACNPVEISKRSPFQVAKEAGPGLLCPFMLAVPPYELSALVACNCQPNCWPLGPRQVWAVVGGVERISQQTAKINGNFLETRSPRCISI